MAHYAMYATVGRGATAAVHLGKLVTEAGFERLVALKRLAPDLAADPYALTRFVDEARLTSRVQSANVAGVIDAVVHEGELVLVMEYVHGPSLAQLIRATIARGAPGLPPGVAIAIVCGALRGLHAAHVAKGPGGAPLRLVHRDVSPQNVLVGADGVTRVVDFGIALAAQRVHRTRTGLVPGKLGYMAPEQLRGDAVDHRADIYAAAVVAWEALAGERLFAGSDAEVTARVLGGEARPLTADVPEEAKGLLARALATDPEARPRSALELARALERAIDPAPSSEVASLVADLAADLLEERARAVAACSGPPELELPVSPEPAPAAKPRKRRLRAAAVALVVAGVAAAAFAWRRPPETREVDRAADPARDEGDVEEVSADPPPVAPAAIRAAPRRHAAPRKAPAPCDPPYVVDPDGHKRWKRECF